MLARNYGFLPVFNKGSGTSESKILERIMHNRLESYLNENKLLSKTQFGFRKGHSKELALLEFINLIREPVKNIESLH